MEATAPEQAAKTFRFLLLSSYLTDVKNPYVLRICACDRSAAREYRRDSFDMRRMMEAIDLLFRFRRKSGHNKS